MKIKFWHISLLLIMIMAAACGPATETVEPTTEPTATENGGALETATEPAPVATAPPQPGEPEAYPAQPTAVPQTEGYPAPGEAVATVDPYPEAVDGFVWMLLPAGVQCEEDTSLYSDLQDAVAGLKAVDAQTSEAEVTELMVCTACGCPASTHYRVQVSVEDVSAAQTLGWTREPQQ